MFERWITDKKTKQKVKQRVFSIQEKIKHYKDISKGKKTYKGVTKTQARKRLAELKELNNRTFAEPEMVVTDDFAFGNRQHKSRGCVVVGKQGDDFIVAPVNKRNTTCVVLDEHTDRQISNNSDGNLRVVNKKDIYEIKYIDGLKPLTNYDKAKIKDIFKEPVLRKNGKK